MDIPAEDMHDASNVEMESDDDHAHNTSASHASSRVNSGSDSGSDSSSNSDSSSQKSRSNSRKSVSDREKSDSDGESGSESNISNRSSESGRGSSSNKLGSKSPCDSAESEGEVSGKSDQDSSPTAHFGAKSSSRGKRDLDDLKQLWEENPEEFGIRRSGRSRKEPERYNIGEDSDGSDSKKGNKKRIRRNDSQDWKSSEESGTDSEDSSYQSRKKPPLPRSKPTFNPKQRISKFGSSKMKKPIIPKKKLQLSSESDDDSFSDTDDETKKSLRQGRKKVSYKEQSADETDSDDLIEVEYNEVAIEEEASETIEKVLEHRIGKKGATGGATTVYTVDDFGDPNETEIAAETEEQYLIKWKGWSYLHNTWESDSTLKEQKVAGLKKLEKYLKIQAEINQWKSEATPEDVEFFDCKQELEYELRQQHMELERIIAHAPSKSGTGNENEYFCKWSGLPYAESTWEEGSVITKKFQYRIDEYFVRIKSQKIPSKICKPLKFRPKFIPLKVQPKYVGGPNDLQLRDYQLEGLNWLSHSWCKENSVILADEMGLGKTIQTISFLAYLFNQHSLYGPFLLVVPLSTMTSWQREFQQWSPETNVVTYVGDVSSRSMIRDYEWCHPGNKRLKFNVLLTTYELLLKDKMFLSSISWAVLGVDEAHRLKNDDSLLYKSLFEFDTNHRLLITGTPLQNSLRELWALLHFIMPHKFSSWEEFEMEHEDTADKGYPKLHKQLEPYLIRRVKKDVEKSLPAKVERILRVEMTNIQKQFYKWILTRNYAALSKGLKGNIAAFSNIVMELKKCCNHAMLIRPVENPNNLDQVQLLIKSSGKLVLLDKLLCRLRETGHRVLIFSQMVRMLDILAEYLQCRHFPFQRLDGSIRGELRKQALDHFNAEGSMDFCFLLSTRAGGLGINLATADTVIIFDSDWNPQNDLQAQARAHRIGQKNQVNIYRLVTKQSVEEQIIERAKRKMVLDHLVIQRMDTTGRITSTNRTTPSSNTSTPFNKEELAAIIQFGAEDLFKENTEEDEEPQVDIDEILSRAETREDQQMSAGEELLSSFKVASINFNDEEVSMQSTGDSKESIRDWNDIIPEEDRKKFADELKEKEEMDMYLPPRSRKSTHKASKHTDSDGSKHESGGSGSDDNDSDEEKPRKRGRPRLVAKEAVKGFTDVEIRRFMKSYKKFSAPLKRLEAIAMDAELQEKPLADLRRLGEMLKTGCDNAMKEHKMKEQAKEEEATTPPVKRRGRERGPTFKLGGVTVNAKTFLSCESELEPLDVILPSDSNERKSWILQERCRDPHFDVLWGAEDDSNLLKGIYEYGLGNWESIKMDPNLGLGDKILPDGEQKPQAKNLQNRCDYLLKILKRLMLSKNDTESPKKKSRRGRKPKTEKTALSKAYIENDDSDASDHSTQQTKESKAQNKKVKAEIQNNVDTNSNIKETAPLPSKSPPASDESDTVKKEKKSKKSSKDHKAVEVPHKHKAKKAQPVMHFTANAEPQIIETTERNLKNDVFLKCKEQMRPTKKYLMRLDMKGEELSEEEKKKRFSQYLVKIGRRINELVMEHQDAEKVKEWRNHLWVFVSHFTEQNAKQLYKIYRQAAKNSETTNSNRTPSEPKKTPKTSEKHVSKSEEKPEKNKASKSQHSQSSKRPLEEESGQERNQKSSKRRYYAGGQRKESEDKGRVRKDSFTESENSEKGYGQKNSYSATHHGYSGMPGKRPSDHWGHNQGSGWSKERYNNDYNKRDHYQSYSREKGGNYHRGGKSHRPHDYPYNPDRHNNRYHQQGSRSHGGGNFPHYGMRPPPYGMQQPPPAHSGYGYASPHGPIHPTVGAQPPPPGVSDHSPMENYSSYQGNCDTWRRHNMDSHKNEHSSSNYKGKH